MCGSICCAVRGKGREIGQVQLLCHKCMLNMCGHLLLICVCCFGIVLIFCKHTYICSIQLRTY